MLEDAMEWALTKGAPASVMTATPERIWTQVKGLVLSGADALYASTQTRTVGAKDGAAFGTRWGLFSVLWGCGSSVPTARRVELASLLCSRVADDALPKALDTLVAWKPLVGFEPEAKASQVSNGWRRWIEPHEPRPRVDLKAVTAGGTVIATADTRRNEAVVHAWLQGNTPAILCGPPGSGKTMTLTAVLNKTPGVSLASLNFSSGTTPESLLRSIEQHCMYVSTPNGLELCPVKDSTTLVVLCDEVNLPAPDPFGTQTVVSLLREMVERGGFWRPGKLQWVNLRRIRFVGACNPPTDPGRHPLSPRFLRHAPVLFVDFPATESLERIYGAFNAAVLATKPVLAPCDEALTTLMVRVYERNRSKFLPEAQPHYVYSPRELTRWVRAVHQGLAASAFESPDAFPLASREGWSHAMQPYPNLVRLAVHEGVRLFADRLVTSEEQRWCEQAILQVARDVFPLTPPESLRGPFLFSTWLSGVYESCSEEPLRRHLSNRLRVFSDEVLSSEDAVVPTDTLLQHALRASRALSQHGGHLLLVGAPGAGKTLVSRLVAWLSGMAVFSLSGSRRYGVPEFEEDLRSLIRRSGLNGERIAFLFDEGGAVSSAFLERMNSLLASGEVPGLFEGEEASQLVNAARTLIGGDADDERAWGWVYDRVRENLHVVFTLNPPSGASGLADKAATSPALFNRCVVDWFGDWSLPTVAHIASSWLHSHDLEIPGAYEEQARSTLGPLGLKSACAVRSLRLDLPPSKRDDARKRALVHDEAVAPPDVDPGAIQDASSARDRALLLDAFESLERSGLSEREASIALLLSLHQISLSRSLERPEECTQVVTPRDALELVRQFRAQVMEQRTRLEDQQRHLTQGLDKLQEASSAVEELQASLAVKERELADGERRAADKLAELVKDQKVAEAKRDELSELSATLAEREAETSKSREEVQTELSEVEPALEAAKEAVGGILPRDLSNLRRLRQPPDVVQRVLQGVVGVVGSEAASSSSKALSWDDITKAVAAASFISTVTGFNPEALSTDQLSAAQAVLDTPGLTLDRVEKGYKACGPLFLWLESQVKYANILRKVAPLRSRLDELEKQAAELRQSATRAGDELAAQEASIATLKADYATLIREAESLKTEMQQVRQRVVRSQGLIQGLKGEQERWAVSRDGFSGAMANILGDAALSAAFVTYFGRFDFRSRKTVWEEWGDCATYLGVRFASTLSPSMTLTTPRQRQVWSEQSLPTDSQSVSNAAILHRCGRYPLVVDPSGTALAWISNALAAGSGMAKAAAAPVEMEDVVHGKKSHPGAAMIATSSQEDPSFVKDLVTAMRFGKALIVRDVEAPTVDAVSSTVRGGIDALLFPILSKDISLVGGRSLVRVAGQEVDLSPEFRLILLCSEARPQFPPAASSRLTVVDFGVTPESLHERCLDEILRTRCPRVQAARGDALAARSTARARLRELEEGLLEKLRSGAGHLLEDDETLGQLKTLQEESALVRKQGEDAEAALASAELAANDYANAAMCAAEAFLALEALSGQFPALYAPSLAHFVSLIRSVLDASEPPGDGEEAPAERAADANALCTSLLSAVLAVESAGLLHSHRLALAAHLASIRCQASREASVPSEAEVRCLWPHRGAAVVVPAVVKETFGSLLSSFEINALSRALGTKGASWAALAESLGSAREQWVAAASAERGAAVGGTMPVEWLEGDSSSPASLLRLAIVSAAVCPSKTEGYLHEFVRSALPTETGKRTPTEASAEDGSNPLELFSNSSDSLRPLPSSATPILLASAAGKDGGMEVARLAAKLGIPLADIPMGGPSAQRMASAAVARAWKDPRGSWVLLRNCHLDGHFVAQLVRTHLRNAAEADPLAKPAFRLWLGTMLHGEQGIPLPASVVASTRHIVFEPATGLQAALTRAVASMDEEAYDALRPVESKRVWLGLAWAHAVLEERVRLAPIGFATKYEFGAPDLDAALRTATALLRAAAGSSSPWSDGPEGVREHLKEEDVPWRQMSGTITTAVYGARASTPEDRRVVTTVLERLLKGALLEGGFEFSLRPSVQSILGTTPTATSTVSKVQAWVASLEASCFTPEVVGLPASTERRLAAERAHDVLAVWNCLDRDKSAPDAESAVISSAGEGRASDKARLGDLVARVMRPLQEALDALSSASPEPKDDSAVLAVQRAVDREIARALQVGKYLVSELEACRMWAIGKASITSSIDSVSRAVSQNRCPLTWVERAGLGRFLRALPSPADACQLVERRLRHLAHVLRSGGAGSLCRGEIASWLGVLDQPIALLQGLRQVIAARESVPLEALTIRAGTCPPEAKGLPVLRLHGIMAEACDVKDERFVLTESATSKPIGDVWVWWQCDDSTTQCIPVYLLSDRSETIALASVASDSSSDWVLRGCALVLWDAGVSPPLAS
jgi:dynein heavy chain 1, cytosolic